MDEFQTWTIILGIATLLLTALLGVAELAYKAIKLWLEHDDDNDEEGTNSEP